MRGYESGAALVEFALLLPFLAVLVFGTIDLGRAYSLQNAATNMAREGAFVAFTTSPCPFTELVDDVTTAARNENADLRDEVIVSVTPSVSCPQSVGSLPPQVTVEVSTEMDLITPLVGAVIGSQSVTITGSASVQAPGPDSGGTP